MTAGGFTAADFEREDVEVWPEHHDAWLIFTKMTTQWRADFNGRAGLVYESLYPLIDRLNLSPDEWDEMFDDVRVLESAALKAMHAKT
jgi:hypothetical protein